MTEQLRPGKRLFSAACDAELIVVTAPADPVALTIGGHAPLASAAERSGAALVEGHDAGSLMGKRYVTPAEDLEILCVKPGSGSAAVDGEVLSVKGAAPLPASD